MFQRIYPRSLDDRGRSSVGLLEELGELAEAVRVFHVHPQYFLGEAADTFSYIMGIANEHAVRMAAENDAQFSFQKEFLKRYPGLCTQCGSKQCICPSVPQATIGRMAKELSISGQETPFIQDVHTFFAEGKAVAHEVLENSGGYTGLTEQLPFDRGDANHALVSLCHVLAESVAQERPDFAELLRAGAFKLTADARSPGSPRQPLDLGGLLKAVEEAWRAIDNSKKSQIKAAGGMMGDLGDILDAVRVLIVFSSPKDVGYLRLMAEYRAIKESVRKGEKGHRVTIEELPAATPDDLRRALREQEFDIVHFSGHANSSLLLFERDDGTSWDVPLDAVAELLGRKSSLKCVILNACESAASMRVPISTCTIGMDDTIEDDAAIEFSRGFYEGIAAGMSPKEAYAEGVTAVKFKSLDAEPIVFISAPAP